MLRTRTTVRRLRFAPRVSQSLLHLGTGPNHPGSGVRRGNRPPDRCLYRLAPLRLSVHGALSALCYPASLESPGRAFPRFAVPLRLKVQGSPSVANPLDGATIHWIVALFRLAHGTPVRRAKGSPDPLQSSGSPLAHRLSGRKVHGTFLLVRFALPGPPT